MTTRQQILAYLKAHPTASLRDISTDLGGITRQGVQYHIQAMVRKGEIKRIPAIAARWEIVPDPASSVDVLSQF